MIDENDKPDEETPAPDAAPPEPIQPDPEADAVAAFEKGAAEATDEDEAAEGDDKPEVKGEADEPEGEPAGESKEPGKEPEKDEAAKQAEAVEKEITELGLKEKTAERFRELAKRPSDAEVAPLRERSAKADEWERVVMETGATPEQFGATINYTALAVRANNGDIEAAKAALQATKDEYAHWSKMLGMEGPGIDPLAEHPDLAKEVEDGDLTRARALEIVQQRSTLRVASQATERQTREQQAEAAHGQAVQQAITQLGQLNATLKASDPQFVQKLALMKPTLELIRNNLPPQKWVGAIQQAYAQLPAIPAPVQAAPVGNMPLRPTGATSAQKRQPKDDMEAFEMGAARA